MVCYLVGTHFKSAASEEQGRTSKVVGRIQLPLPVIVAGKFHGWAHSTVPNAAMGVLKAI